MIYRFDAYELDIAKAELRSQGQPVAIEPQVLALLAFLVENRERLVSKDEIFEKIWERRVVSDSALSSRIKSARKALGDDGRTQRYIKTAHGQGFRFMAEVRIERDAIGTHADAVQIAAPGQEVVARAADVASRPSIAVLPFRLIGDAGPYAAIADGLPHELITELARLRWLFVIARGSSFRLRGDDLDLREVGVLLQVRYCLTGSVEISGQHLAVTAELVDTRGGDLVWAERYSGSVDDIHTMRSEIRSKILSSLEIQIPLHEASGARLRDTADLDAWSAYHLGLQHIYRFNRKDNAIAAELFSRAVAQDPDFARAHAGLSFVHFQTAFMAQTQDIAGEIRRARDYAQRGIDIDPLDPFVNFTMGRTYWLDADLDRAQAWLERSVSLSPNYAQGIYASAWTDTMAGNALDARGKVDLAMRLSPLDSLYYAMISLRGFTHMLQHDYAEAAVWTDRAAKAPGAHVLIAMIAAVAQSLAGDRARAMSWVENVRERNAALTHADFFRAFPVQPEVLHSQIATALRELGF